MVKIKKEPELPMNTEGIGNWGGHLFKPSKNCPYKFKASDGGVWTDIACCNQLCKKHCNQLDKFRKMKQYQRIDFLRKHGVRYV